MVDYTVIKKCYSSIAPYFSMWAAMFCSSYTICKLTSDIWKVTSFRSSSSSIVKRRENAWWTQDDRTIEIAYHKKTTDTIKGSLLW